LHSLQMQILHLILNMFCISKISSLWIYWVSSLPKWTCNYCTWWVGISDKVSVLNFKHIMLISRQLLMIMDNSYLQTSESRGFTLRDCSDFTKILLISWNFTSRKFTIATCNSLSQYYTDINKWQLHWLNTFM